VIGLAAWMLVLAAAVELIAFRRERSDEAERARRQEEIARAMLSMAGNISEEEDIDPDHMSDVLAGLAQADRNEFATDAQVEAAFRRFDR
jgi:biopolymer transport protein ExbB/TolQ